MFEIGELSDVLTKREFQDDYSFVRQSLADIRLGLSSSVEADAFRRLRHFVEAVLASAPNWSQLFQIPGSAPNGPTERAARDLCRIAAEIAELLSADANGEPKVRTRLRLRAALLYELSELPAVAQTIIVESDLPSPLSDLMVRAGVFQSLLDESPNAEQLLGQAQRVHDSEPILQALAGDAILLALYEQGEATNIGTPAARTFADIATDVAIGLSRSDLDAFASVMFRRVQLSTRANIRDEPVFQLLRRIHFPPELWSAQLSAINGGLLDEKLLSWGMSSPTGTGKTFLTRLLIAVSLRQNPGSQVLYVVPSRALVHEVKTKLEDAFRPLSINVLAVTPQLVSLDSEEERRVSESSIIVLTPEKADLLLRLGPRLFERTKLVIVDEAHHIEAGTRGVLLELYLWRIRRLSPANTRFVFLSAVTPNIRELVSWLATDPATVNAVALEGRATRMRVGTYRLEGKGKKRTGWIDYTDGSRVLVVHEGASKDSHEGLVELALALLVAGPVLVVTRGKREAEKLAARADDILTRTDVSRALTAAELEEAFFQRLDSRAERELYPDVLLRRLVKNRVAYHHAGLPPRVRTSLEDAIRRGVVDLVFSTTTLAEGVNFPFSSVIVQTLALREPPAEGRPSRYSPVTPRSFWNIAGRAGRPGHDKEGQVILFTPSLDLEKVDGALSDYINTDMRVTTPVRSALARGIELISDAIDRRQLRMADISTLSVSTTLPEEIIGTVNMLRVGLVHGRASGLVKSSEDIIRGTFAAVTLTPELRKVADDVVNQQAVVVDDFFNDPGAPSPDLVAELGLSLETLSELRDYVRHCENWQIQAMEKAMFGGGINVNELEYVVRPVASRMAELGGKKLGGGFLGDIVVQWFKGIPFTSLRQALQSNTRYATRARQQRLEDLITLVYTRVQYLLPWGLYAMDRLVEEEARRRSIPYSNPIQSLAYLADAGVPNLDALRLVGVDIERVDATRLAAAYARQRLRTQGIDIVSWLMRARPEEVVAAVRGRDSRRLDYDLLGIVDQLRRDQARA